MSGITIKELGYGFVKACMEAYWGSCLFPVLFAAGLLWMLFSRKRDASRVFWYYTVFLFLTVYNPVLVKYIVPKVKFENEYYRFIWILPVIPAIAYYGVRLIWKFGKSWQKFVAFAVVLGVIVAAGSPVNCLTESFTMAENIYKIPDELRTVCDLIHQDRGMENPRVVFDTTLNNVARQYDPSMFLVINRNAAIYRSGSTVTGTFDEKSVSYKRQKIIMDVVYYQQQDDLNRFQRALKYTKTDYLVVKIDLPNHDFIRSAGCETVAVTENYVVYYFDWQNQVIEE